MITQKPAQNNTARKTAIILLAAGKSTRFAGSNKLSQELSGIPMLTHCYNNINNIQYNELYGVKNE